MIAEPPQTSPEPAVESEVTAAIPVRRVVVYALPDDREQLLAALGQALQLGPLDVRVRARHLPGVLPETLSVARADALIETMRQFGVAAEAIAPHEFPNLAHTATVHHVRCTEPGLEIVPLGGTAVECVAWPQIELISIADVPLDAVHHSVAPQTVMVRSAPRKTDAEVATIVRGVEMWIICRDPFRAIRIDHREMNYEYLGATMSGSAAVNFRRFTRELVRLATCAMLTPMARAYLSQNWQECRLESQARHRELVQYYDLLSRRTRELQQTAPHDSHLHCLRDAMAATPAVPAQRIAECHESLLREIEELQAWIRETDEYGKPQFGQLGDRITALRRRLAEHFAFEEEGGYMAEPLAAAPQFAARIEELKSQHPSILAALDGLTRKLKNWPIPFACWSTARQELQQVLDTLSRHEQAENDIWQEALDQDVGSLD